MRRWWYRDPLLRLRCAWNVLRGRPLAYRLLAHPTLVAGSGGMIVQCQVGMQPPTPEVGIRIDGERIQIIGNVVTRTWA